jgi:hypothetical protein
MALESARSHTREGNETERVREPALGPVAEYVPGEFVSEGMRADCARFLDELRAQISRRSDAGGEGPTGPPSELDDA